MTPHITMQAPLAPAPASADLSGDVGPLAAAGSGERSPGTADFDAVLDAELHDRARPRHGASGDDNDPKPVPSGQRLSPDVTDREVPAPDRADRGAADPHSLGAVVAQSTAVTTEPIELDRAGTALDVAPKAIVDGEVDPTVGAHVTADMTADVRTDVRADVVAGSAVESRAVESGAVESGAPIDAVATAEINETAEAVETAGVEVGEPSSERSIERAAGPREQLAAEDDELRAGEPVAETAPAEPSSVEHPAADPPSAEGEPLLTDEPTPADSVPSDSGLSNSEPAESVLSESVLSDSAPSDAEPAEPVLSEPEPSGSETADLDGSRDVELESELAAAPKPDTDTDVDTRTDTDVDPAPNTTGTADTADTTGTLDSSASSDGAETQPAATGHVPSTMASNESSPAADAAGFVSAESPSVEPPLAGSSAVVAPSGASPSTTSAAGSVTTTAGSVTNAEPATTAGDHSTVDASSVDVDLDGAWDPIRQIMSRVRATGDGHDLRLRLHPADLGEVAVQVRTQGGELTVSVVTSTAAARDALQADRNLLLDELADAGFEGDRVDVSLRGGDEGGDGAGERAPAGRGRDDRGGASDPVIGDRGPDALRPGRRSLGDALVVPTLGRRDATVNLTL